MPSSAASEREKASCACFEAAYGPAGANATVPATETMLTTCEGRPPRDPAGTRAAHQTRAEVVRPHDGLDPLRLEREEVAAPGHAGVVDEQVDPRVPLEHASGDALHRLAVADVAELELAAELLRQRLAGAPRRRATRTQCQPLARERARHRLADPARRTRDDRYAAPASPV